MQVVAWQDARFSGAALDGIAVSRSIDVSGQAPRRSAPRNEPLANRLLRR